MYTTQIIEKYHKNENVIGLEMRNEPLIEILNYDYKLGVTNEIMIKLIEVHKYYRLYYKKSPIDGLFTPENKYTFWNCDDYGQWFNYFKWKYGNPIISWNNFIKTTERYDEFYRDQYWIEDGVLNVQNLKYFRDFWKFEFGRRISGKRALQLVVSMNNIKLKLKQYWNYINKYDDDILFGWDIYICGVMTKKLWYYGSQIMMDRSSPENTKYIKDYFINYPSSLIPEITKSIMKVIETQSFHDIGMINIIVKYTGLRFINIKIAKDLLKMIVNLIGNESTYSHHKMVTMFTENNIKNYSLYMVEHSGICYNITKMYTNLIINSAVPEDLEYMKFGLHYDLRFKYVNQ